MRRKRASCLLVMDKEQTVRQLLGNVLDRAERQLSYKGDDESRKEVVRPVVSDLLSNVRQNLETVDAAIAADRADEEQDTTSTRLLESSEAPAPTQILGTSPIENYGQNPTITMTALAHELWKHVIRPGDTVIDATAGNGGDSLVIANLLFASLENRPDDISNVSDRSNSGQLIAIDILEEACENTRSALSAAIPNEIFQTSVQVLQQSHAPLPCLSKPVALVVYNLGFLPNSSQRQLITTTDTTIQSLADAALLTRIGGMLSVMTYPRTNPAEHQAVRILLQGLALFTSNTHSFVDFVTNSEIDNGVRELLLLTLKHIRSTGSTSQTWRVHEHRKLGWIDAPTLYTATRIK